MPAAAPSPSVQLGGKPHSISKDRVARDSDELDGFVSDLCYFYGFGVVLKRRLRFTENARLALFPAAGHAAHFQYAKIAAEIVLEFLNMEPKKKATKN